MDIINFDTAKLAKEAGFDGSEHLEWYYTIDGKTEYTQYYDDRPSNSELGDSGYAAPLQPELQEWLMEQDVHLYVYGRGILENGYSCMVFNRDDLKTAVSTPDPTFKTYHEALENGLQRGLKCLLDR